MNATKPILVTGSHHSGTSWVGSVLSLSNNIGYIHEPFNILTGVCKSNFKYWYTYIDESNEDKFIPALSDCLKFKYHFFSELFSSNGYKDILWTGMHQWGFLKKKFQKRIPLMKDPISLLSAGWLQKKLDMTVVICIRHPAAFAGSLKKEYTAHPFNHFLEQKNLMDNYLADFKMEIESFAKKEQSLMDQAALLWNIMHWHILQLKEQNNHNFIFVRHEDLSRDPKSTFKDLYAKANLKYDVKVSEGIDKFILKPGEPESWTKRDPKKNILNWKNRLTLEEIAMVKKKTAEISQHFYSEEDW